MPPALVAGIRPFRSERLSCESDTDNELRPFLTQEQAFRLSSDLESGRSNAGTGAGPLAAEATKLVTITATELGEEHLYHPAPFDHVGVGFRSKRRWPSLRGLFRRSLSGKRLRPQKELIQKARSCTTTTPRKQTALRRVLHLLAISLMLLGLLELIALVCGLLSTFFPDELEDSLDVWKPTGRISNDLGKWPTDFSADVHPVACHSHNDYWRKEPLFSALEAGCTGVEADVWLFNNDLFVGHTPAALTSARTLRSLYVDPLLKILDQQNPITPFHQTLDAPRHGVFDTKPSETLVLLIDFKTEGDQIWPYVNNQLEPLRQKKYLTYFNGTDVVDGPITVVATGNAPFDLIVANPYYRDIFFDAPLDLMATLSEATNPAADIEDLPGGVNNTSLQPRSDDAGQGYSGAAPLNPSVYSRANSYYASVSFQDSLGWPWRGRLSHSQKELLRKQIAGAHARGLKVRYWGVPSWPRGMRNYLWRVLVKEGVDYLNVDDLRAATTSDWGWERRGWWSGAWFPWS